MSSISTRLYAEKIKDSGITNVFVATDDNLVIQDLKFLLPSNFKVFTFSDGNRRGFSEEGFRITFSELKKRNMHELFADVEALINSDFFIGTFSSCIGQYVNLMRFNKLSDSFDNNFYFD